MTRRFSIFAAFALALLWGLAPAWAQQSPDAARPASFEAETKQTLERFSRQKARLLEEIDTFPAEADAAYRAEHVDPVFERLAELRARVHREFDQAIRAAQAAEEPVAAANARVEEARARLETELERQEQLSTSNVWKKRVAAARAQLEQAEAQRAAARKVLQAHRRRVREYAQHIDFFAETISPLLERITDEQRDAFFALEREENWQQAMLFLRNGLRSTLLKAEQRVEQLLEKDPTEVEFWTWLWGLVWRLAVVFVVARFAIRLLPALISRLTSAMLERPFLRRRATLTIKTAETLHALSWPLVVYLALAFLAGYAAESLPEFEAIVWIIDAAFIYWTAIEVTRVLALPRWYRRSQGHPSAEPIEQLDEDEAGAIADLLVVELERAQKLVRSVQVVVVFWLLAAYLPDFVESVAGVSVIWWVVDRAAAWGFVGVVYWVLSQWKDDIAAGFEHLASERLAGSVDFVKEQKDKPWGVLVIAVASLYVLFKEIAIIGRRYVLNTRWFRRASTFVFRTKIEIRRRDQEKADAHEAGPGALADEYLALFANRPLTDEPYLIERRGYAERVLAQFDRWSERRSQGSALLVGEPGVGKTTLLQQLRGELSEASRWPVMRITLERKLTHSSDVVAFLADIFSLEEVPPTVAALVERLEQMAPRVVLIDDCHNAFSRQIEGFDSLDTLLDVVNLCDEAHFFVLTFNRYAWNYANRIHSREHYFGTLVELAPWSEDELQELVEQRNAQTEYTPSFNELLASSPDDDLQDYFFEIVKTANGYFRYLHEFCGGNPSVALVYWLRSLRGSPDSRLVQVRLFQRPSTAEFARYSDDHWFLLGALAQHGELDAPELSRIINAPIGFCNLALDYFAEEGVVTVDEATGRARLTPLYMRQVLRRLSNSNFLYG